MPIRTVEGKRDLKQFLELPYRLYKDDPVWVPPLRSEQAGQMDPKRNPMLARCEYALFLLEDPHRGSAAWPPSSTPWRWNTGNSRSGCSDPMSVSPTKWRGGCCWRRRATGLPGAG